MKAQPHTQRSKRSPAVSLALILSFSPALSFGGEPPSPPKKPPPAVSIEVIEPACSSSAWR